MQKIEHIGIAVENLAESEALFSKLLNSLPYKRETIESEEVITSFFRSGGSKLELLQGTSPNSVITKYVQKYGSGMHHIAFSVSDIHSEMTRLKQEGFILLSEEPKAGADNKLVCFLHPKSTNKVLVELCQERKSQDSIS